MKIAFLGDLHFGCRNSNQVIQRHQELFLDKIFWPYIEEKGIKTIIQTGDYFDNRKWINLQTMSFQKRIFVDRFLYDHWPHCAQSRASAASTPARPL